MKSAAIPSEDLNRLRGTRVRAIRWDVHRAECHFDLYWTDQDREHSARLVLPAIQYSRFEFDESVDNEVIELISIEAENCAVGIRLFGEFSNGTFEFVCTTFRLEPGTAR